VNLRPLFDIEQRLEYGLRVGYPDVPADEARLSAALEIYGYAVEELLHHADALGGIVPVRDEDVEDPGLVREPADVPRVLYEDRWLVVCVGQSFAPVRHGQSCDIPAWPIGTFAPPSLAGILLLLRRSR